MNLWRLVALPVFLVGLVACGGPHTGTPRSGFVDVDGDRLYYEVTGDGPPVVLISGGSGMDLRQWDAIVPRWSARHLVVRYDPRGVGRSDNPTKRYSDAEDLQHLLDHLALERVTVVGVSSAGGLALEFALRYPQRVSGVIAAAPFVPGFGFSEDMLHRLAGFSRAAEQGREPFLDAMFDDPHFIPAPLVPEVRATARENMALNFDKGAGIDPTLAIALEPPLIERLGEITAPVQLVAGELEHPEVLRRNLFLAERLPAAAEVRIVAAAGHNTHLENPQGFDEAVGPFLERADARSRS